MKKTLPFHTLIAILLLEQCQSEKIEDTENVTTFIELTDSHKAFQDAVIVKLTTLSEESLKLGIKLLQDTYDDNLDNERLKKFFADGLREYRNIKTESPHNKIKLFLSFSLALDFFSGPINDDTKIRDLRQLIKEALEKHGAKGVTIEFQKSYDEFLKWLLPVIEEYSQKLTSEEQLSLIEFKKLCLQFKEETNWEERSSVTDRLKYTQFIFNI